MRLIHAWRSLEAVQLPLAQIEQPALTDSHEVHLWVANLDQSPACVQGLHAMLQADEQARAARFITDELAARYSVGRGVLRVLLGQYLERPPQSIEFRYNPYGKPSLKDNPIDLQFNISHTQQIAVYAFTRQTQLGVDIEAVQAMDEMDAIAQQQFSTWEYAAWLAETNRQRTFYHIWTRKEAYIKAVGKGLAIPLDSFDVSLNEPPLIRRIGDSTQLAAAWKMLHFEIADQYIGAVAVKDQNKQFKGKIL